MTLDQLKLIMPYARKRADLYFEPISSAMDKYSINTYLREAAFLAQIAHESAELRYVEEIASGAAYEGRKDLGNTQVGDGVKFKGRSWIQITGRANYEACGKALGIDLIAQPELLETPQYACEASCWWWKTHGLNELADKSAFITITRRINGGLNGIMSRTNYYNLALKVLKE